MDNKKNKQKQGINILSQIQWQVMPPHPRQWIKLQWLQQAQHLCQGEHNGPRSMEYFTDSWKSQQEPTGKLTGAMWSRKPILDRDLHSHSRLKTGLWTLEPSVLLGSSRLCSIASFLDETWLWGKKCWERSSSWQDKNTMTREQRNLSK